MHGMKTTKANALAIALVMAGAKQTEDEIRDILKSCIDNSDETGTRMWLYRMNEAFETLLGEVL